MNARYCPCFSVKRGFIGEASTYSFSAATRSAGGLSTCSVTAADPPNVSAAPEIAPAVRNLWSAKVKQNTFGIFISDGCQMFVRGHNDEVIPVLSKPLALISPSNWPSILTALE